MNPKSRGGERTCSFLFFFFPLSHFFFSLPFSAEIPRIPAGREGGRKEEGEGGGGREVDKVESVNYKPATGYPGRKVDPQS